MSTDWITAKFKDCFNLKSGDGLTAKKMVPGDYDVFGGNGVAGKHNDFNLSGDNVIVGRVGALCGNARHITEDIWLTDNAFKITKPIFEFNNKFLTYLLNYKNLRSLARQAAQPVISNSSLADLELSFPNSIEEQKRIVTILDQVFADIEKACATAETNLKNARELFDSYLQQVFSQRGEGWVDTTLGKVTGGVFTGPFGSLLHKSDYVQGGIPLVNPAHITSTGIEPDINKTVTKDTAKRLLGYVMSENDIVIGRRGEMGRCAIVTSREAGFLCGTGCFFIKSSKSYNSSYLVRYLRSSSCVQELNRIAGGAVMPNLSNKQLSNLIISIPPLEQQTEILHLIDELSSNIETVTKIYKQKLDSLNELKKSILQKAFSGELTKSKGIAA